MAEWSALPDAGLASRFHAASVWTGTEFIVWGGFGRSVDHVFGPLSDGAAFVPGRSVWRPIAGAPKGLTGSVQASAWSGQELLVVATDESFSGTSVGGRYRPSTDSWQSMAVSPLGARDGAASVWTGTELLVVGGVGSQSLADPATMAYLPATDTWRTISTPDFVPRQSVGLVWTGTKAIVIGLIWLCTEPGPCNRLQPAMAIYDPTTDQWSPGAANALGSPEAASDTYRALRSVLWDGQSMIVTLRLPDRILAFDPARATWTTGSVPACAPLAQGFDIAPILIGTEVAWVCADGSVERASRDLNTWTRIAEPTSAQPVAEPAMQWTGRDLLLWGGVAQQQFNATLNSGLELAVRSP